MSKYIDKEVLLERMNRTRPYEGADGSFERYRRLQWLADMGQVNMCPAADVVEVRHGRWILGGEIGWPKWTCTVCGGDGRGDYKLCPWCGAKMDEVEE